jgi:serpin B
MKSRLLFSLMLLIIVFGCNKENIQAKREPKILQLPEKSQQIIQQSNKFGIDLFKATSQTEADNLMLSPLSASTALTMLLNGCNNETYNQIHQMLGYEDMTIAEVNETYQSMVRQLLEADPEVQLALANAVWYRQDYIVKPPFLQIMDSSFNAHVEKLDFLLPSALENINGWASDNTNGKIPKVMDEISSDAVMFLMNALYFKGSWTQQFDKDQTSMKPFYPENGSPISVPTMFGKIPVKTYATSDYRAIELTYGRTNFSMVIIVPANSLPGFLETFDNEDWQNLTDTFDENQNTSEIEVSLPKFKFTYEKVLNDQLASLGMIDAFDSGLADLSGISDNDIFVSFVKQNTFVDVNEEGTEAAAVTTIGIVETSMPMPFEINKPFVFAIRERTTNSLLFLGKVIHPEY